MDLPVLNTFTCTANSTGRRIEALRDSTNAVDAMVSEYRKRRDQFIAGLVQSPDFAARPGWRVLCVGEHRRHRTFRRRLQTLLEELRRRVELPRLVGRQNYLRFSLVSARNLLREASMRMQRISVNWRAAVFARFGASKRSAACTTEFRDSL
jgi:hypothetical protein